MKFIRPWVTLVLVAAATSLAAQSTLPARRDWQCLSADEKQQFVRGLQTLAARDASQDSWNHPFDNSLSWYIALHNGTGEGATCTHGDERFLTWHRAQLYLFEGALQRATGNANFRLPYWNWGQPPTGKHYPIEFETDAALMARRDNNQPQKIRFTNAEILQIVNDNPTFAMFGGEAGVAGALEHDRHNTMHTWVGGQTVRGPMYRDTTAAIDPLFWLFHCYIDAVFDRWQRQWNYPTLGCPDCPLQVLPGWTPSRVARTESLGYVYDLTTCPAPAAPAVTAKALAVHEAAFDLTVPEQTAEAPLLFDVAVPAAGFSTAELRVRGAELPSDFSYHATIYAYPSNVQPAFDDAAFRQRYRVDDFTVWALTNPGGAHAGHGGHSASREPDLYANATTELRYLAKTAPGTRLRVAIVVDELHPIEGQLTPELERELRRRITIEDVDLVLNRGEE